MLKLHTSHRLERLVEKLAEVVQTPLRSVLQPELIMVQSQGMARWLKLELARQQGICANCAFPFPKAFCAEVLTAAASGAAASSQLKGNEETNRRSLKADVLSRLEVGGSREVLLWRIMRVLPTMLEQREFHSLKAYLASESDTRRRYQLAWQIANLFDQYLVFRPELVLRWETTGAASPANADELWQAALWRALHREQPSPHLAALLQAFHAQAATSGFAPQGVPERLSIFGISALPPSYLGMFRALGEHLDVHLFLLQPSREYWGTIVSARESGKVLRATKQDEKAVEGLHLEPGNRLLASMGKLGRDFLNLVLENSWDEDSLFDDPPATNLLQHIQADIFHLRDRGRDGTPRLAVAGDDSSLRVHACHSPLREVEVLHDHLLDWFRHDRTLTPRDVLVLTPDIEAYAPFIEAVFDSPEATAHRIPFSVADRGVSSSSHVAQTFLSLLELAGTRLEATVVLRVLEAEPVRHRFGLSQPDLDIVRDWIRRTNIRWGRDAQDRQSHELPALPENTWQHGMARLFAGYSMAGGGEQMFGDVLPFEELEGGRAEVLGHLAEYLHQVFKLVSLLRSSRPMAEWQEVLLEAVDNFLQTEDRQLPELLFIRTAIRELAAQAAGASYIEPVDLATITEALSSTLGEDRFGSGFITGGVTFCALKPMRSIPFKVICLLGMNDGAFPRADQHLSFDLMAQKPRLGDRSLRDDDRYLFLETLLSARQRLHISYVGQSIRDNSEIPPSVLVSEVLDYVTQAYELERGAADGAARDLVKDRVLVRHRLQAFSPVYFSGADDRLFSYSAENCEASRFGQSGRVQPPPFLDAPLTEPGPEFRSVDVDDLASFFCNPARWLLTRRLGLRFEEKQEALEEAEPFEVGSLDSYGICQELVGLALKGSTPEDALRLMRASGRLPLGEAGAISFRGLESNVQAFLETLRPHLGQGYVEPLQLDCTIGEFRLTGAIRQVTANGLLQFRCTNIKPKDQLRLWIQHLALNAAAGEAKPSGAVLVGEDAVLQASPMRRAPELLKALLGLYWNGLTQPLKFFPKTSLAYAEAVLKLKPGESADKALAKARLEWEGNDFNHARGEGEDPYLNLCFRNSDPLDEEFAQTAQAVYEPLLAELKEVES